MAALPCPCHPCSWTLGTCRDSTASQILVLRGFPPSYRLLTSIFFRGKSIKGILVKGKGVFFRFSTHTHLYSPAEAEGDACVQNH